MHTLVLLRVLRLTGVQGGASSRGRRSTGTGPPHRGTCKTHRIKLQKNRCGNRALANRFPIRSKALRFFPGFLAYCSVIQHVPRGRLGLGRRLGRRPACGQKDLGGLHDSHSIFLSGGQFDFVYSSAARDVCDASPWGCIVRVVDLTKPRKLPAYAQFVVLLVHCCSFTGLVERLPTVVGREEGPCVVYKLRNIASRGLFCE